MNPEGRSTTHPGRSRPVRTPWPTPRKRLNHAEAARGDRWLPQFRPPEPGMPGLTGGPEHLGTEGLGELHRQVPDAPTGVHEQLPRMNPRACRPPDAERAR
jgi:hypothetical protein